MVVNSEGHADPLRSCMQSVFLSVVVCTRNRADELVNCLPGLAEQAKEFSDVEVVVVDNGSTDNTREVVSKLSAGHDSPLQYSYEAQPGLCRARNHGRMVARGEALAYVDDDVRIGPGWIKRVRDHFLAKKSDCLAGRVKVDVEGELPAWFPQDLLWVLGETTLGDEEGPISFPLHPQGNNFAITKEVFDTAGGFDPRITLYGDETEFFRRVSRYDFTTLYDPNILVTQHIPAHRLTQKALQHKAYIWGRGSAMVWMLSSPSILKRSAKVAEYALRTVYVKCRWYMGPSFGRYYTFWKSWGYVRQLMRGLR